MNCFVINGGVAKISNRRILNRGMSKIRLWILNIRLFDIHYSSLLAYICGMLSKEDEDFIVYWEKNSLQQKHSTRPFMIGLSAGFILGISLIAVVFSGWYERANMVANSRLSSVVFLIAIMGISVFMAFMYRKFRWETYEQRYRELLAKKKSHEKNNP